jgi:hypothetical protein
MSLPALSLPQMSLPEAIAFWIFVVMTVAFFLWVAYLAARK